MLHLEPVWNKLFDLIDMGNEADRAVLAHEVLERLESEIERIAAQATEPFIDKHGVELNPAGGRLDDIGEAERKRQSRHEPFTAREGRGRTQCLSEGIVNNNIKTALGTPAAAFALAAELEAFVSLRPESTS